MAKPFTPKLSPRLEGVVSLVPKGYSVADVGCDHGYISISLIQRGIATHCIASDIKEGPLAQAEKNIIKAGLEDKIETRLMPGVNGLQDGEAEVIVIAGMGCRTICCIINDREALMKKAKYLVLQPQSEIPEMRIFLEKNGYKILKNRMMREGDKYYFAMIASATENALPGEEMTFADRMKQGAKTPEIATILETYDHYFGLDLIYSEPELSFYLHHVDKEWTESCEKLRKAKKPDFEKIMWLESKASMARGMLELNMSFCGASQELKDLLGLQDKS